MLTSRGQTPASDLRNRMTSVNNGDVITTYSYDDAGNRVEEVDDGSPLYYLIDPKNPTGYAQPIEQREGGITGTPQYTFIMGNSILAQGGFVGVNYLLTDGHGSTRDLVGGTGTLSGNFNYDAFGNSLGFRPNLAGTIVPFGGDGLFDTASGLYFHSSGRQSNSVTGEFIEADPPGFGSNQDPISLHKYLYANGNPVNGSDPTGHFTQGQGYAAEAAIQAVYATDHPGSVVGYGGWTRLGIPGGPAFRLKPDIFNTTTKRWAEIKPLSPSGVAKAAIQFTAYSLAFAPFGYLPDAGWTPSTHFVVAGTMPIIFFNAGGIIFYSDATDLSQDLIALTTIAAVRSFMASQLGQRLATSAVEVLGDLIPGLAGTRVPADEARLGGSLGIAGLLGVLGFI